MIIIRKSEERGHASLGWLDSYHTFSFASYHDPAHMNFYCLRVINEDRLEATGGFAPHHHRDMEIITYVLSGELAHKDSMGNQKSILPGEVQTMSAGTGVTHSEFNNVSSPTHLLQIWITPDRRGHEPSYAQKNFSKAISENFLTLAVSPTGTEGSLIIHQNAKLFIGHLRVLEKNSYALQDKRVGWVQVLKGSLELNNFKLSAGDGAGISNEAILNVKAHSDCEFLLFDLPEAT